MAKVKLGSLKLSQSLTDILVTNVKADLVSDTKKRKFLGAEFDAAIQEKLKIPAFIAVSTADLALREQHMLMMNNIAGQLQKGFPAGSFEDFTPWYKRYKAREKPGTEHIFWKFRGGAHGLAAEFRKFANRLNATHGFNKSGQATHSQAFSTVKLAAQGYKYRKMRYRLTFELSLPEIKASEFRDIMFRKYFMDPNVNWGWEGAEEDGSTVLATRMVTNEAIRPWIRERVRKYGKRARIQVLEKLRDQLG